MCCNLGHVQPQLLCHLLSVYCDFRDQIGRRRPLSSSREAVAPLPEEKRRLGASAVAAAVRWWRRRRIPCEFLLALPIWRATTFRPRPPRCAAALGTRTRGAAPVLASAPSLAASHATLAGSRSHVLRLAGSSPPCHGGSWLVEPWRYASTGERNEWLRETRERWVRDIFNPLFWP